METLADLMQATEGVRAATGHDYFPEVTAFYQQAAISEMAIPPLTLSSRTSGATTSGRGNCRTGTASRCWACWRE